MEVLDSIQLRERAGTRTRNDRLEQFTPVIEELCHVQQDLLEKIFKTYYKTETAREACSLANYRPVLHRTNVNAPPAPDTNVLVRHKGTLYHVAIPAENAGKTIQLKLNGDIIQINVPAQNENVQEEMEDYVQKFNTSIVRVAIDFIVFCEVIKEGDMNMISILMKRFIPPFIGLSA
ncbi:hypothetical protein DPMN_105529 [Dreissena polymorpha]|uniref:Uncharacterized protein n=1 Tax=Dreissena polymorpha TaxID=45954 RepID=A0A9D4K3D3_DREPO|nr:hypothetical protein DPMN_105529 [Dreissena polymorpha]